MTSLTSRFARRAMRLGPPVDAAVTVTRDVAVPMDDGVDLRADVYEPAGAGSHPTVLVRSPYGRRGPLGLFLGRVFAERGYRVVLQSCRGTFGSGGRFDPYFDERADGLATVRWIRAQEWFDGRLAMNGPSYLGHVQWAIADSVDPPLAALCTHVTFSAITGHWYRGGSFSLGDAIEWTAMVVEQERRGRLRMALDGNRRRVDRALERLPIEELDVGLLGERVPFWRGFVEHPSADDPHWAPIDHSSRVPAVSSPVLQVGGWYDLFLPDQLADHEALVEAGHEPRLVIGPWTHTAPGGFRAQLRESLRWLDRHLRGQEPDGTGPVRLFVMGADEWRDVATWPPAGYRAEPWFLHRGGRVAPGPPEPSDPDRYVYDPDDPTPAAGGTLLRRTGGARDQGVSERRPDVLVFTSDTLSEPLELVGAVLAEIHVGSDREHFDVFVRLCDVDRRGRSRNVCDGLVRVSPTRSPRPPDGVWAVRVELWPTAYRFAAGHRVRVQVTSGAHPRFARNLGTDEPLASGTRREVAHQAVFHEPGHASSVTLPVEDRATTPRSAA